MHAVIFEARPRDDRWDAYLGIAKLLRPELEKVDGFLENIRFRSRRRPGWLLSLSTWRDEAALLDWRRHALHRQAQARGRQEIFEDYHLRVGRFAGAGEAAQVTVLEFAQATDIPAEADAAAERLGLPLAALAEWDLFDALLEPGRLLALLTWRAPAAASAWDGAALPADAARRDVRLLRDYGMFRRDQAPRGDAPVEPAGPSRS